MTALTNDRIKKMVLLAEAYLIALWDGGTIDDAWVTHDSRGDIFMYVRDWGKPSPRQQYKDDETYYVACDDGDTHIIEFYLYVDGEVTDLMVDTVFKESTGVLTIEDCHVK